MGIGLTLGTANARAQDHDIHVSGVWAEPEPLECPSTVYVRLYFAGERDHIVESGDIVVTFEYELNGTGQWTPFGDLPVLRAESDISFSQGAYWPDDFDSDPNNGVSFEPQAPGEYRFRATADYTSGLQDGYPNDNTRLSNSYTAPAGCGLDFVPIECYEWAKGTILCLNPGMIEEAARIVREWECDRYPELPGCGGAVVDICKYVPCPLPPEEVIEVFFDDRYNGLNVAIVTERGRKVAEVERLRTPVREGGKLYTQRLQFPVTRGEGYYIAIWPGESTRLNVPLPLNMSVRRMRREK
jgi:hypothetical protein